MQPVPSTGSHFNSSGITQTTTSSPVPQSFFQTNQPTHLHRCEQRIQTALHANSVPFSTVASASSAEALHASTHCAISSITAAAAMDGTPRTTNEHLKLSDLSSSCMASILAAPSKQRAETFMIDEVRVLLHEIGLRKQVLLSLSPSTNRLKRRAWEEVATVMAARWPHSPRRTADQVKKKWENLVSKTKRKIRNGHVLHDSDWSETNSVVMEFLAKHSPWLNVPYGGGRYSMSYLSPHQTPSISYAAAGTNFSTDGAKPTQNSVVSFPSPCAYTAEQPTPGAVSTSDGQINFRGTCPACDEEDIKCGIVSVDAEPEHMSVPVNELQQTAALPSSTVERLVNTCFDHQSAQVSGKESILGTSREPNPTDGHSIVHTPNAASDDLNTSLIAASCLPSTLMNPDVCDTSRLSVCVERAAQKQLLEHAVEEHMVRMEILHLQRRAWELQVELLRNAVDRPLVCGTMNGVRTFIPRDKV
ncbi:unnamed protein product [Dicrocoelium dendriticum]|nr:unnamed protein product [Dicrocoelium dendriticum]